MPNFDIDNVGELLSIALGFERDSAVHYQQISKLMQQKGNSGQAQLFSRMAESEKEHAVQIERMVAAMGIDRLPETQQIAWQHPGITDFRERATNPATSTPYLALAYATNNEEQAFRFYSYVAANSASDEVRKLAEAFAKEELMHAALFRRQRRKAYHEQPSDPGGEGMPDARDIVSVEDMLNVAIRIEKRLARLLIASLEAGQDVTACLARTRNAIRDLEVHAGISACREATDSVGESEARDNVALVAEQGFLFYSSVVEATDNEEVMLLAQEFAHTALQNLEELEELF